MQGFFKSLFGSLFFLFIIAGSAAAPLAEAQGYSAWCDGFHNRIGEVALPVNQGIYAVTAFANLTGTTWGRFDTFAVPENPYLPIEIDADLNGRYVPMWARYIPLARAQTPHGQWAAVHFNFRLLQSGDFPVIYHLRQHGRRISYSCGFVAHGR